MNHVSRFLGVFLFIAAISQFHLECYAEFAQDGDGTIASPFYTRSVDRITGIGFYRMRGQSVSVDSYTIGTCTASIERCAQMELTYDIFRNRNFDVCQRNHGGEINKFDRDRFFDTFCMTYDRVNFSEAKVKNFPRFIRLPSGAETQITSLWKYVGNRVTTTMTFDPVLNSGTINASATKDHAGPPTPINDLELLKYDFKFKYVESNYEVESDNANGWAGAWKWEVEIARVHPLIGSIYTYSTTSETRPAAPLVVDPPPVGTHLDWIFQFFPSQVPGDLQLWSSQHPLPVSCNFSEWDYDYIFQGEIV